ncbi:hypothetical protein AAVH_25541 [Aphelenchoides avenae]|nr:hypothetical protein AAVH_39568 [Aphelenchus avenae]KAH7707232.1 hypothetical protein AAVH_25541 [Aphelenchus avenae]
MWRIIIKCCFKANDPSGLLVTEKRSDHCERRIRERERLQADDLFDIMKSVSQRIAVMVRVVTSVRHTPCVFVSWDQANNRCPCQRRCAVLDVQNVEKPNVGSDFAQNVFVRRLHTSRFSHLIKVLAGDVVDKAAVHAGRNTTHKRHSVMMNYELETLAAGQLILVAGDQCEQGTAGHG